jgi:SAM-dependent methyltransferase
MRFYDREFAELYHNRLKLEGYPGALLTQLMHSIGHPPASIIDVGAGTGFFAIPLASEGFHVTAVEPSSCMIDIMRRETAAAPLKNLTIKNSTWENWTGSDHDISIAVHSLYPMADPVEAVDRMIRFSEKRIVIVRDDRGQSTLSDAVRAEFNEQRSVKNIGDTLSARLKESGVKCVTRKITERKKVAFRDADAEADYFLFFLKLPPDAKDDMIDCLKKICSFENGLYVYDSLHSDLIMEF